MARRERSLEELYRDDPERADANAFGRRTGPSRRGFLKGAGYAALSGAVGAPIVFGAGMPAGLVPAALAQDGAARGVQGLDLPGKDRGLIVLSGKPLAAEAPTHLLDDDTTPTARFYVSNSGIPPDEPADLDAWKLTVDGEVNRPLEISLGEIKQRFKAAVTTQRMVLESGGNGRSLFTPQARGIQWGHGGVGCAEWRGVPLVEVLRAVGVKSSAVYTAHTGADRHASGDAGKETLSRGVTLAKAADRNSMLVWEMNGAPLPSIHGGPLRLVISGWPGSVSHKWLTKITLRDRVHDGEGMGGTSYRVAIKPMVPGGKADDSNFKILESMPVRSITTSPASGTRYAAGTKDLKLRGAAWAGDLEVRRVDVSIDFGATWRPANISPPKNRFDWRRWTASVPLPSDGYYEVWVRATDSANRMQPHFAGGWNPQGYGANPMHRIAVLVG